MTNESTTRARLYTGDTFEHRGYRFRVVFERDDDMGEPWKEHDGHGIVSDWTHRDKRSGERVLAEHRGSRRYYDVAETTKIARRDSWGCKHSTAENMNGPHQSIGERTACAVDCDFDRLRAWCSDQWEWTIAQVILLDENGRNTDTRESLGGIEPDEKGEYLTEVAYELADQIIAELEVESPDVQLSEN